MKLTKREEYLLTVINILRTSFSHIDFKGQDTPHEHHPEYCCYCAACNYVKDMEGKYLYDWLDSDFGWLQVEKEAG